MVSVGVDQARYGKTHRKVRARMAAVVSAGGTSCTRCGELIVPGEPWDLDHADDGNGYTGAAHRYCNRAAPMLRKPKLVPVRKSAAEWRDDPAFQDDPDANVFWGPPDLLGDGSPRRWSRAWYDWRAEVDNPPDFGARERARKLR